VLNLLGHGMEGPRVRNAPAVCPALPRRRWRRSGAAGRQVENPALDSFGRDLTELARQGKLDPVIGREKEIERTMQILGRRTKNNPVLLARRAWARRPSSKGSPRRWSKERAELLLDAASSYWTWR